jgi:lysophospholipase L1-like esterase
VTDEGRHFPRVRRLWRGLALLTFNGLLLFLVANGVAVFLVRPPAPRPPILEWGPLLPRAYPGRPPAEVVGIIQETWSRPLEFDPFVLFHEAPCRGRFVNVTPAGYRLSKNQGPWPLDHRYTNVFVFGGSTTFGYGVPDDETVPSFLQESLAGIGLAKEPRVYNFGNGFFYSTQERILFEELATKGLVPDVAIFVDGLNDFIWWGDEPYSTDRIRTLLQDRAEPAASDVLGLLPVVRAARSRREVPSPPPQPPPPAEALERVLRRYDASRKLIAGAGAALGVKTVFVWQPVASYKYDLRYHIFASLGLNGAEVCGKGYEAMAAFVAANPQGPSFLWLADLQAGLKEPLYVDRIHYNPGMGRLVARAAADLIRERGLLR